MSVKKIYSVIFLVLAVNFFSISITSAVGSETPTISNFKNYITGVNDYYLVSGGMAVNSEVLVYIDGSFINFAEATRAGSGNTYRYRLGKVLDDGQHKLMIIGRDKTSMVLSPPTKELVFNFLSLPKPPAPTIVFPLDGFVIPASRPVITGLTKNNTRVRVYLDGILAAQSGWLFHRSGTANFALTPAENLKLGNHSLMILAEDQYGQISANSKIINFRVEKPLPAPVILRMAASSGNHVQITGVALNDLIVKVYVDNQLDGQFRVKNNISGTANFAYISVRTLTNGAHSVYTQAINDLGKRSGQSNIVKYIVTAKPAAGSKPIITPESASEEFVPIAEKPKETGQGKTPGKETSEPESQTPSADREEIEELIKNATSAKETETGVIDESKSSQSKIKLNLIIFIIFLLAVIGWIFWVNRELIKERKAQNDNDSKDEKDKSGTPFDSKM